MFVLLYVGCFCIVYSKILFLAIRISLFLMQHAKRRSSIICCKWTVCFLLNELHCVIFMHILFSNLHLTLLVGSYNRGWFYHKEHRLWFLRVPNLEPLVKTNTYERSSYHCFDPSSFETIRKVGHALFLWHYLCCFLLSVFFWKFMLLLAETLVAECWLYYLDCRIILLSNTRRWKRDQLYLNINKFFCHLKCKA